MKANMKSTDSLKYKIGDVVTLTPECISGCLADLQSNLSERDISGAAYDRETAWLYAEKPVTIVRLEGDSYVMGMGKREFKGIGLLEDEGIKGKVK